MKKRSHWKIKRKIVRSKKNWIVEERSTSYRKPVVRFFSKLKVEIFLRNMPLMKIHEKIIDPPDLVLRRITIPDTIKKNIIEFKKTRSRMENNQRIYLPIKKRFYSRKERSEN